MNSDYLDFMEVLKYMDTELIYSSDEENFKHEDLYDAVLEIVDSCDGFNAGDLITVWSGELTKRKASGYLPNNITESLSEIAFDNIGEYCEGWPDSTKEQNEELQERIKLTVDYWADKHKLQPKFGEVSNAKAITLRLTLVDPDFDLEFKVME